MKRLSSWIEREVHSWQYGRLERGYAAIVRTTFDTMYGQRQEK